MKSIAHLLTMLLLGSVFSLASCSSTPQSRFEKSWTGFYYVATVKDGQIFLVMTPDPGSDYHGLFRRSIGPFVKGRWDTEYVCGTNPIQNGVLHIDEKEGIHYLTRSKKADLWWYSWSYVSMKGIPVDGHALDEYESKP